MLANAVINISIMGSEEEKRDAMRALRGASGYLRRELGARLHIRQIPELHFKRDDSIEEGAHVFDLLREVLPAEESPAEEEAAAGPEAGETQLPS